MTTMNMQSDATLMETRRKKQAWRRQKSDCLDTFNGNYGVWPVLVSVDFIFYRHQRY